ncbi:MAG: hypothetical protein KFB95_05165 [Simkaniaceae bacterium]|nr:MAG: hypothetical protein KFB95_05165 [Simkaniaceae bacterium]
MKPDIYINVRFRTTSEWGRVSPLGHKKSRVADFYACPMIIDDKAYDCRLLIGDQKLIPGLHYKVPVVFVNRDLALPNLSVGKNITLWEGKEIADGQVTRICD